MTNTMASSGISSQRDRLQRAAGVAHGEGLTGPPLRLALRKWAATVMFIVALALLRTLSLCVAALLGLAPFFASRLAAWIHELSRS
jgi:hypothetical protein